jgi:PKD repeat protein
MYGLLSLNQPLVIAPIPNNTSNEGDIYNYTGSFSDPDPISWTGTVDYGDGSGIQPLPINPDKTFTLNHQFTDNKPGNAPHTVTVVITDDEDASDTEPASVTVSNVAPQVAAMTVSGNPVQVNTATTASSSFTDPAGTQDAPYTFTWNWGDGNIETETVSGPGAVAKAHTYTAAGVYEVILTVTDKDGGMGEQSFQYLSVYSPTAQGLFSGGQKYTSPFGAYSQDPTATGTVKFGLSYKYQGDMPSGNRQFTMDFQAGNFEFNATTVSSLVIANGIGTLRGTGTITNSPGVYDFLVIGDEATDAIRI